MKSLLPRCAAAVDHADTELIGHDRQLETLVFVVVQENDFSTAAPTCPLLFQRGGSERLYTFLHPTACRAGEDHEVARGDLPMARFRRKL